MQQRAASSNNTRREPTRRWLARSLRCSVGVLPFVLAACTPDAGTFELDFVWEDGPPDRSYEICSRLEPSSGGPAIALAPASYEPGGGALRLDVPSVPNGEAHSVIVDVAADCTGSRIEYHGSAPIVVEPGASFRRVAAVVLERTPYGSLTGLELPAARAVSDDGVARVASPVVDLHVWPEKTTRVAVALDQNFTLGIQERALSALDGRENPRIWRNWNLCGAGLASNGVELGCEDGLKQVFVKFLNDTGLPSETFERVVSVDTRAPLLEALSVDPEVARAGVPLVIRLTANEPLEACPEIVLPPPLSLGACAEGGSLMVEPQRCEYCANVSAAVPEGQYEFSAQLVDRVGHTSDIVVGRVQVDQTEPGVSEPAALSVASGASVDGQALVRAGETLSIGFVAGESLVVPAKVNVEGDPAECDPPVLDAATGHEIYTCRYVARVGSGDGPRSVSAVLQDRAGHTSRLELGIVYFDVDLPAAVNTSLLREPLYAPAIGNGSVEFSPTDPFTGEPVSARLTVFASKAPDGEPELRVLPLVGSVCPANASAGALPFQRCNSATDTACPSPDPQVLSYVYTLDGGENESNYCVTLTWRNSQGDTQTELLPVSLSVTLGAQNTIAFDETVHVRVPWGAEHTAGVPRFSVLGRVAPGVVSSRPHEVSEVLVSSNESMSGLLGRAVPDASGGFDVSLPGDSLDLFAAQVNRSGNVAPFLRVRHGEWVATLGRKVPGSAGENPHQAFEWGSAPDVLVPDHDGLEISGQSWGRAGDAAALTHARLRWLEHPRPDEEPPPARTGHAMAYDPQRGRTVMFGGKGADGTLLADTSEWDGVRWRRITPIAGVAPVAREGHAMVYHAAAGQLLLFGGASQTGAQGDTWLWDGRRWREVSPDDGPSSRSEHALTYDSARGAALLVGGSNQGQLSEPQSGHSDQWEWDGARWQELTADALPPVREAAALAYDARDGRLLLIGGAGLDADGAPLALADRFSFRAGAWREEEALAAPLRDHTLTYDPVAGQLLLFGGTSCEAELLPVFCLPLLDPAGLLSDDTGQTLPSSGETPPVRHGHAAAFDTARGKLVLFGGNLSGLLDDFANDTWEWDGTTRTWRNAQPAGADAPAARDRLALAHLPEADSMILFGGQTRPGVVVARTDETWSWDGSRWRELGSLGAPPARSGHALAYDSSEGRLLLFGGLAVGDAPFDDLWSFTAESAFSGSWARLESGLGAACTGEAQAPCARQSHGMSHDGDLLLLLGGGPTGASTAPGDFWSWDEGWHREGPSAPADCDGDVAPCARGDHGWACEPAASPGGTPQCTLFGGTSAGGRRLGDTWTWNGQIWTRRQIAGAQPSPRTLASLVPDSVRHRSLLFGGQTANVGDLNDSWEWDGERWLDVTPLPGAFRPPARNGHAAAYSEPRGEGVLFGGAQQLERLGDTWVWFPPGVAAHSLRIALESLAPAARLRAPGADASAARVTLDRVSLAAVAGGNGGGADSAGAEVRAWAEFGWSEPGAANEAPVAAAQPLCWSQAASEIASSGQNTLEFQLRPVAATGSGQPARLTTDYVEVRVAYHFGDGSPASQRGPAAYCR